ncbi:MAG: ribosome maturation factor RimP [Acidobacteria bacterium]|nr:ribosome maturation factor RimP [Acidobacteriota bacterium]
MRQQSVERISEVVEPIVTGDGFEVVHVELVGHPRHMILRLYIDKPGGVTVDDCASVSNHVGALLDVEDLIPSRYVLEVCSPGLERGLYKLADFERFAGREAKIQTYDTVEGRRTFYGELLGTSGEAVTIRERSLGKNVQLPYQQIRKANLVFHWGKQK